MVGLIELFKFVDGLDQLLILIGVLCASVAGCMFPLMFYIFGDLTNAFALQAVIPPDQFMDLVVAVVWKMCAIGKIKEQLFTEQLFIPKRSLSRTLQYSNIFPKNPKLSNRG